MGGVLINSKAQVLDLSLQPMKGLYAAGEVTVRIRGLNENTLVIYTADHGFSLGHNGYWGHGQATWPSNAHRLSYNIPMLIRHSNYIQPLQVTTSLFSQVDLFAIILVYVGLGDVQGNQNSPSCSFASVLRGEQYTPRYAIFIEQEETRAVRTDKWLYMRRFNGSRKYPAQSFSSETG